MSNGLTTFKSKLSDNGYGSLTGAKRAIGKFQGMTEAERNTARSLADKFFGGAPTPAPAKTKAKVGKKAAGKKVAAKAPTVAAAPAAAPVVAAVGNKGKGKKPKAVASSNSVAGGLNAVSEVMTTMAYAIDSAKKIHDIDATVDVGAILKLAAEGITAAQKSALAVVGISSPRVVHTAPVANGAGKVGSVPLPGMVGVLPGMTQGA